MVSLRGNFLSLIHFFRLDQIPKLKICHIVAIEYPEVVEGRRWLIHTDVLDSEEAAEDGSIDDGVADSDEENESGSGEAGMITGVTQSGT